MTSDSDSRAAPRKPRRSVSPRVLTGLVLAALVAVFILENRHVIEVRVLVPVVTMPLWSALLAMVVIGVVIGLLVTRLRR